MGEAPPLTDPHCSGNLPRCLTMRTYSVPCQSGIGPLQGPPLLQLQGGLLYHFPVLHICCLRRRHYCLKPCTTPKPKLLMLSDLLSVIIVQKPSKKVHCNPTPYDLQVFCSYAQRGVSRTHSSLSSPPPSINAASATPTTHTHALAAHAPPRSRVLLPHVCPDAIAQLLPDYLKDEHRPVQVQYEQ